MEYLNYVLLLEMILQESCIFFVEGNTAILTNGFTKKTQKTPAGEIKKANLYRTDYYMKNNSKE